MFFKKRTHNKPLNANIPVTDDDKRLDKSVDRLMEAHENFTKILQDFTRDIQKQGFK